MYEKNEELNSLDRVNKWYIHKHKTLRYLIDIIKFATETLNNIFLIQNINTINGFNYPIHIRSVSEYQSGKL